MNENFFSHKGYQGSAHVSIEDECLHGKIMFIGDLITYEAESIASLRQAFEDAVEHYIAQCSEMNMPADDPSRAGNRLRHA